MCTYILSKYIHTLNMNVHTYTGDPTCLSQYRYVTSLYKTGPMCTSNFMNPKIHNLFYGKATGVQI